ncbi:hypothetical protein AVEN_115888-1 [Araneus ventricosus]|uniref:Uncharacterized protein n=1 Tax=Araneus ventricosus TaxID=182803 RepID=A0A4Y2KTG5_ARAVE|nr:hypothetical protein AVEN_115888-1 [Araneus ventricosus]
MRSRSGRKRSCTSQSLSMVYMCNAGLRLIHLLFTSVLGPGADSLHMQISEVSKPRFKLQTKKLRFDAWRESRRERGSVECCETSKYIQKRLRSPGAARAKSNTFYNIGQ